MSPAKVTHAPNDIKAFIHCKKCIEEWSAGKGLGQTPRDYARINVGWTVKGLQIWCVRHDLNIAHIDFEGQQHPAR